MPKKVQRDGPRLEHKFAKYPDFLTMLQELGIWVIMCIIFLFLSLFTYSSLKIFMTRYLILAFCCFKMFYFWLWLTAKWQYIINFTYQLTFYWWMTQCGRKGLGCWLPEAFCWGCTCRSYIVAWSHASMCLNIFAFIARMC